MSQAAKFGDPVLGVDIHLVMVPTPAPVPTPLPHPFIGVVFDPLGAAIGAAMGAVFGGGGPVLINWLPVGNTGIGVKAIPHFPMPPGVSFAPNDIPGNHGTMVTGSKTVHMAGSSAGRLMSMVSSCGFPLNLPTSVCMAIPMGPPVLIGGPTAMDWMAAITTAIRTKWFSDALHKLLKPGKWLSKAICFLTGHPVDVMSGRVLTDRVDFELPGPIPLAFECNYDSRDRTKGPMGPAWHHPLEASVEEVGGEKGKRRKIIVRLPDGRTSPHEWFDQPVWDPIDRYELRHTKDGYRLTFWDGRAYHFARIEGTPSKDRGVTYSLVRITDRCDNAVELRYQAGWLAEVIDSMGRKLRFTTRGGRLEAVELQKRSGDWVSLVRYEYDEERRLTAAYDPKGHAMRYAYEGGVLVRETNRNGLNFYFEYDWYDPAGYCLHTWGDGGIYDRRITYDTNKHITVVDDSRGGRTTYYGNAAGLVDREVDPTGREKKYEWHPRQYRKTAEIDGAGNRTEWVYDDHGNTVLERNALGQETRWVYNALNVVVERIDAASGVWKRQVDACGNLVRATNPLGEVTRFQHGARGNLLSVEDPKGRTLTVGYTAGGELSEVSDWEGHVTRYEYDDRGQLVKTKNPLGATTTITRDPVGLPVVLRRSFAHSEAAGEESEVRMSYDPERNLTKHVDALGNVTELRYAHFNKLVEQRDAAGGVVAFAYDKEGDLVGVTNEAGETYAFELDLAGRVVKEHGFDGRTLEFWYDQAGRCNEIVNAQRKRTGLERDALGRVVKQTVPRKSMIGDPLPSGEAYEYGYDALGGLVRAKNDACEVLFVRDALGRVVEERSALLEPPSPTNPILDQLNAVTGRIPGPVVLGDMRSIAIGMRYDTAGNRMGRTTSLGHETRYDFDGNGGLLGVTFNTGPMWSSFAPDELGKGGPVRKPWQATFARDALGNEAERRLPGGIVARWERDDEGRPREHRMQKDGVVVASVGYEWRANDELAALHDGFGGTTRFAHDARSYLVAAQRPDGTVQYRTPDAVGNVYRTWERTDRQYGKGGRLERAEGVSYEYDDDGQLVAKMGVDGERWEYTWDFAGQLTEVRRPDGQKVALAYDALGRRVRKSFAGKATRYVWDGNDLVHELAEASAVVTWVFDPGRFTPLAKVEGDTRYGFVTDHLDTPRTMVDEAGALAWKAQLDLYGVPQADVARTDCPWRWPGQYEDAETGLFYNRFRYYDRDAGIYTRADPLRLLGGLNAYTYVPDPFRVVDPFGLADVGLGLTRDPLGNRLLGPFAESLGAIGNQNWIKEGLATEGPFVQRFYQALYRATSEGGRIKFNLDYLSLGKALGVPRFSDPFAVGVTNWELQQVLHNGGFYKATDFYIGGQKLTPEEVEEFGLGRRVKGCK